MTTIVVARKAGRIAIAADSLVTFGDLRLPAGYEANQKILRIQDSYIGIAGTTAHFTAFGKVLASMPSLELHSREQVFETFLAAHARLKEEYFLNTKEDEGDPYESSQVTALIVNPSGMYGVYSYREVFCFERFWAIGSGRNFALGAMHACYGARDTARDIATVGLDAGIEFDRNSGGPHQLFVIPEERNDA